MALLGRHRIVAAFLFSKGMERDVFETTSRLPMLLYPLFSVYSSSAFATGGNGNIDGGGGSMGQAQAATSGTQATMASALLLLTHPAELPYLLR